MTLCKNKNNFYLSVQIYRTLQTTSIVKRLNINNIICLKFDKSDNVNYFKCYKFSVFFYLPFSLHVRTSLNAILIQ